MYFRTAILVEDNEMEGSESELFDLEMAEESKQIEAATPPQPRPSNRRLSLSISQSSPFMSNLMRRTTLRSSFAFHNNNDEQ